MGVRRSMTTETLQPIERVRLSQNVVEQIREAIVSGKFKPGDRLPSEHALGKQLSVGRTSIREALRALEALGLTEVRPGRGTFVRDTSGDHLLSVATWDAQYRFHIAEILEVRLCIETKTAFLAAERASMADIRGIEKAQDELHAAIQNDDLLAMTLADIAFHDAITQAAKNEFFVRIVKMVDHLFTESRRTTLAIPGRALEVFAQHQVIAEAITRRDSHVASEGMHQHLSSLATKLGITLPM